MSDDYYESIGKILNSSFSNNKDPFENLNKKVFSNFEHNAYDDRLNRKANSNFKREYSHFSKNDPLFKERYSMNVPLYLVGDFSQLGLAPTSSLDECKQAWKSLLKLHHPDLQNDNSKYLNETIIKINDSYRRIERWFNKQGE